MRIAVCTSQVPFEFGGAEVLADALVAHLREWGHAVELVRIPFRHYPKSEILKGYLAWRLINLDESEHQSIDRVLALKFPAYVISHAYKVTWLIHQLRQAYDLHGTEYGFFDSSEADIELREAVRRIDTCTISESKHVFSISRNVAKRLEKFNGIQAEALYPPPSLDGRYYNDSYGDYILSISRLNLLKRVDHLVRAMGQVKTPVRCRIAGQGPDLESLQQLARQVGAGERIEFLGFINEDQAIDQYARALAVYYAPFDEDYGLATVEAMKSGKPVVTTSDSGGVLEFVEDRVTGQVAPAGDPAALAERIDELYLDRSFTERLGIAAQRRVAGITWDVTIKRLLEV